MMRSRLENFSGAAALLAIAVSSLALTSWTFDIDPLKQALPGLAAMNPMTAVGFLFAGSSLWLQHAADASSIRRRLAQLAALAVLGIGLLKVAAVVGAGDFGIDRWLFAEHWAADHPTFPHRMAANSAISFVLTGFALLVLDLTTRRGRRPAEFLALGVLVIALLALPGYAYRMEESVGVAKFVPMALPSAVVFLALSLAVLVARPQKGMMAVVTGSGPGGMMTRLLLPGMVVMMLTLGWLRLEGERRGFYGDVTGVALFTLTTIMLFGALIWRGAKALDLADRKRAQLTEQQRQSEAHIRSIIDTASDAFIAIDAAGVVTDWNHQAEATFGWSRAEAIGERLSQMIVPERHRLAHERGLQHIAATGVGPVLNRRIEITALRRNGGELPVELSIWPVQIDGSHSFNAFVRDISGRRHAEEVQIRLAAIVESSNDAILSKTLDGIITHWNSAAERIFGYSAAEAIGRSGAMLVPRDREDEEPQILARIKRGEHVDHLETVRVTKAGNRIEIAATISPIRDASGNVVGASKIARDITQRKQAEHRILALNLELGANAVQLQQTNRELEAFSYTISHDLRAPLRHIDGYARMLQEDAGDQLDAEMRRYLDAIGNSARQMGMLIDDLLAFSRLGRKPVERVEIDMKSLVGRVLFDVSTDGDPRVTVGALPAAHADPVLLRQVWVNLLSNALKYSAPRGADARVEITGKSLGDRVRYRIRDNGVGFDMRYADKLFGVFQRLHSPDEFEGTGVGLAIVQRIVLRHGGTIEADAEPGRGATFTFELPAVATEISDRAAGHLDKEFNA